MNRSDPFVSVAWLAKHMDAPDMRIVDASWHMPGGQGTPRDARAEYAAGHLKNAVFFDIDAIADTASPLPHMLPTASEFAAHMHTLGIGDGTRVVIYDSNGGFMAAHRAWWMLRVFGHHDVFVLDGGLPRWLAEGQPIQDTDAPITPGKFTAVMNPALVRTRTQMLDAVHGARTCIMDARSASRFAGTASEPRAGVRSGHIPGSINVPFHTLMDNTIMHPADTIAAIVRDAGVDLSEPLVATCGSGVTACTLAIALYRAGYGDVAVYDGSWSEWGAHPDCPVAC